MYQLEDKSDQAPIGLPPPLTLATSSGSSTWALHISLDPLHATPSLVARLPQ